MKIIRTIRLQEAKGKTLQCAIIEDRNIVFLWTDDTACLIHASLIHASLNYDELDLEVDTSSQLADVVNDCCLESLGLITQDEVLQRINKAKEDADALRYDREHQEYIRLKQKFEVKS